MYSLEQFLSQLLTKHRIDRISKSPSTMDSDSELRTRAEDMRRYLKNELAREERIRLGAENLRRASSDRRKSNEDVKHFLKISRSRIDELRLDLRDLEMYFELAGMTDGGFDHRLREEPLVLDDERQEQLVSLRKRLDIELKVKEGSEKLLTMYSTNESVRAEAKQMMEESRNKVAFLTMQIDRLIGEGSTVNESRNRTPSIAALVLARRRFADLNAWHRQDVLVRQGIEKFVRSLDPTIDRKCIDEAFLQRHEIDQKISLKVRIIDFFWRGGVILHGRIGSTEPLNNHSYSD
ncbi:hypothetical protein ACOME3_005987 [Neoechinorhynchus agilis]